MGSKSGARRWGEARERELVLSGPTKPVVEVPVVEVPTLGAFQQRYIDGHACANRRKKSAIRAKESIFEHHLLPRFGHLGLDAINDEAVQQLKAALSDRSSKTVHNVLTVLNTTLKVAVVIKTLHPGKKRLVFVDSRRVAEELGKLPLAQEVDAFVIHGSLSVAQRPDAENAFAHGQNCVIVATSALELGIDVGDLDHVLQIDSPPSVASFLQRMGRTGRRAGTTSNCTLLLTKEDAVLRAAAIVQLHRQAYVEPVRPARRASHVFAHQVMALSIQAGGVTRSDIATWLHGATAFADLTTKSAARSSTTCSQAAFCRKTKAACGWGPRARSATAAPISETSTRSSTCHA